MAPDKPLVIKYNIKMSFWDRLMALFGRWTFVEVKVTGSPHFIEIYAGAPARESERHTAASFEIGKGNDGKWWSKRQPVQCRTRK